MSNQEKFREVLVDLDNQWSTLSMGSPIPGLYPQNGAETVRIKGNSDIVGDLIVTEYTIVILDEGNVVAKYQVRSEESRDAVDRHFE